MNSTRSTISQTRERFFLALAGLLVLIIGVLAYASDAAHRASTMLVDDTRQIVDTTNSLLSSLTDAETGQRGFLLTGEDRYLKPYEQVLAQITPELAKLAEIGAKRGQRDLNQSVEQLKPLVKEKLDELAGTIELRRTEGLDAALAVVRSDRGRVIMDQIRILCAAIQTTSYKVAQREAEAARKTASETAAIAVLGSAGIFVLLVLATRTIEQATRRRQELISALADSEGNLRQSRDWLRTTLSSIGDAVITTDAQGRVTLLNDVAQAITGWRQEQAASRLLNEVFVIRNEETGREVEDPVAKVLREGRTVGLANHTELIAKDGGRIPIDDSAAPIRNGEGKIDGVVLVFRDITERKAAEQAVLRSVGELRTSNAALGRANEDLNQFAFAASHDLQEPLRMIASYSQLLVRGYRGQLDEEAETCIEFITAGTKRMRELLQDLLAYTRVTAGEEQPAGPLDLNRVLETALANCKAAIAESGAVITYDHLPLIQGQEPHFIQLFQNLVSNSLKYRSEQPPRVHVSAEKQDGFFQFAVTDNGIGIAPEYHEQIFGVFKRLHGKTIPGTGIGLAICQRVIHRYGGEIWVESDVNEGSTFRFTVPAAGEEGPVHVG